MTNPTTNPGNNGNGKLNHMVGSPYFGIRILVQDKGAYDKIVRYLKTEGIKEEASSDYILRKGGIARANNLNNLRGIIELTKEVKPEIKEEIEKIVMRYEK
jgi:high-affinity K+ transport system ATPase subunit B